MKLWCFHHCWFFTRQLWACYGSKELKCHYKSARGSLQHCYARGQQCHRFSAEQRQMQMENIQNRGIIERGKLSVPDVPLKLQQTLGLAYSKAGTILLAWVKLSLASGCLPAASVIGIRALPSGCLTYGWLSFDHYMWRLAAEQMN